MFIQFKETDPLTFPVICPFSYIFSYALYKFLQNLEDEVFVKRHQKLEVEEKRRKR